jgi:hypothetical protein
MPKWLNTYQKVPAPKSSQFKKVLENSIEVKVKIRQNISYGFSELKAKVTISRRNYDRF